MVSVRIPLIGTVRAANVEALSTKARKRIEAGSYGASEIGSDWPVSDGSVLCFNGRIIHPEPASVAAYFQARLGVALEPRLEPVPRYSAWHPEFHIGTPCGTDCKAAIDAAAELLKHLNAAHGDRGSEHITNIARSIVRTYVYG